jgi:outer membrane protein OmpA-like peptidoglycan-associated protein
MFNLRIGMGLTQLSADDKAYKTTTFHGDARFIFDPFYNKKIAPFLYAGAGAALDLSDSNADVIPLFPVGLGIQTQIKPGMKLEITGGYNLSNSDMLDGIGYNTTENPYTGFDHDAFYSFTVGLNFSDPGPAPKPVVPAPVVIQPPVVIPPPPPPPVVTPPPPPPVVTPPPVVEVPVEKVDLTKIDSDGDGISDYDEINVYKTDPNNPDTDGDGLNDYAEVMQYKTNPLQVDTDGDGLNDYAEVMQHKTDPLKVDTDGDGLNDYAEVMQHKTDPLKVDTDGDGLTDYEEVTQHKTNPLVNDTDGGSIDDGAEVLAGTNPLDPKDDVMDLHSGATFSLEGILFETNKSTILNVSIPILEQAYTVLAANPEVKVLIIGHTDSVGSESSNQTLSENRANSVRTWLINRGIAANRLRAVGRGELQPRATNDTPEGRALNRRIEFEIE